MEIRLPGESRGFPHGQEDPGGLQGVPSRSRSGCEVQSGRLQGAADGRRSRRDSQSNGLRQQREEEGHDRQGRRRNGGHSGRRKDGQGFGRGRRRLKGSAARQGRRVRVFGRLRGQRKRTDCDADLRRTNCGHEIHKSLNTTSIGQRKNSEHPPCIRSKKMSLIATI